MDTSTILDMQKSTGHTLLDIGTFISVFDPEGSPDDMPIYEGGPEDAHMSLSPGMYPLDYEDFSYLLFVLPNGVSFVISNPSDQPDIIWQIVEG